MLFSSGFAVAMLGLIEAVAIARSIATKTKQNLDGNQEFIGQGMSNIIGSMFMSYAGSGSFTRSGINYQAGAKTPMSAIFAGISLAVILLAVAPLTAYLPIAAMGGIILLVAIKLVDVKYIFKINKSSKRELMVLVVTFLSTLFFHLQFAIYIGMALSLIFYLQQTSKPRITAVAPKIKGTIRQFQESAINQLNECPQLKIFRVDGTLFYGASDYIGKTLNDATESGYKYILIVANGVNFMDVSGAELLVNQAAQLKEDGGALYICALNETVHNFFEQGDYHISFGRENIFINKEVAIAEIYQRLDRSVCDACEVRVFVECEKQITI
jgi:SulP family sulfate permease